MNIREATLQDIPAMSAIRLAVRENVLSNPALVTPQDYEAYLTRYGKGWVCEFQGMIVGFAIVGVEQQNVWALFVQPGCEGKGVGRQLHDTMLDWYFQQKQSWIWLSTGPGTRAETFHRKAGWTDTGLYENRETKFEMDAVTWARLKKDSLATL